MAGLYLHFLGTPRTSHSTFVHLRVFHLHDGELNSVGLMGNILSNFHRDRYVYKPCYFVSPDLYNVDECVLSTWLLIIYELYLSCLAVVSYIKHTLRSPAWQSLLLLPAPSSSLSPFEDSFFNFLFFKRLLCHNYSGEGFAPVGNINRLLWGSTTNFSTHIICLCMVIKLQQYFMQCFPAKLIWFLLFWLLLFCPQALKLNWIFIIIAFCCSPSYLFLFFNFSIKGAIKT